MLTVFDSWKKDATWPKVLGMAPDCPLTNGYDWEKGWYQETVPKSTFVDAFSHLLLTMNNEDICTSCRNIRHIQEMHVVVGKCHDRLIGGIVGGRTNVCP